MTCYDRAQEIPDIFKATELYNVGFSNDHLTPKQRYERSMNSSNRAEHERKSTEAFQWFFNELDKSRHVA